MHRPLPDHLAAERLAALADDELTTGEASHIGACMVCADELTAQRHVRAMARDMAKRIEVPLTTWESLGPALRAEGLMRRGPRRAFPTVWVARTAAAVVLVAGGVVAGRYTARTPDSSVIVAQNNNSIEGSTVASLPRRDDSVPIFRSPAEALATLARAEQQYRHAAVYLLASDTTGQADDRRESYRTRLAALDEVAQTTRAALDQSPRDPVLNQYYLSSVSAREATLRQLGGVVPVGMRLDRY